MENKIIQDFYAAFFSFCNLKTPYRDNIPKTMISSPVDEEGWVAWSPINGTFDERLYHELEQKFKVEFPKNFIEFHKLYFFLDGDCSLLILPYSNPNRPLEKIVDILDNDSAAYLTNIGIYPFAMEGNDAGFLVFDGREEKVANEFPIRVFDHTSSEELDGLGAIIFSSFSKLLECLTHFMKELKIRPNYEIIPEFLKIDPLGAGKYGSSYWLGWSEMLKVNHEDEEKDPWPF